jgi:hypothetical protein
MNWSKKSALVAKGYLFAIYPKKRLGGGGGKEKIKDIRIS